MMTSPKHHIGIVEDNEMVRRSYKKLLELHDFATSCFESAEEFLELDSVNSFDCMVVDMRLPGMTGYQLTQELRSRDYRGQIVLISGNIDPKIQERVKELDEIFLLNKPCPPAEFIAVISQCRTDRKDA